MNQTGKNADGTDVSWKDYKEGGDSAKPSVPLFFAGTDEICAHNVELLDNVQPRNWVDPDRGADFVYDLIAIGAGAGGLISAKQSARRGAKSALIEKVRHNFLCSAYFKLLRNLHPLQSAPSWRRLPQLWLRPLQGPS
jgi:hypothetical protein